ncbi:unnamed protein product [Brassica oleracea]
MRLVFKRLFSKFSFSCVCVCVFFLAGYFSGCVFRG